MMRMGARRTNAKAFRVRFSKSLARRRQRPSQANVRSTKAPRRHAHGANAKAKAGKQTPVVTHLSGPREETPHSQADVGSMTDSSAAGRPSPHARSSDVSTAFTTSEAETASTAERDAVTSGAIRKLRRRADRTKTHACPQAARGPFDAGPAVPDALPSGPSNRDDGASRVRHRSTMARYVFGAELKLGERWKRKLRRAR